MNTTASKTHLLYLLIPLCCTATFCAQRNATTPIPASCEQLILVVTDSKEAHRGTLYCFERSAGGGGWSLSMAAIPVAIGRNGLGWGDGLHEIPETSHLPMKEEGDGRSPAGVFALSAVFGYAPAERTMELKMPYIHVTEMVECVDDIHSAYYNRIVDKDTLDAEKVDWQSSERMAFASIYYELGVVVDHNRDPVEKQHGSCIFLHNWAHVDETTSGCTTMEPRRMREIALWLDETGNPVLVQLTEQLYDDLIEQWQLPEAGTR